MDFFLTFSQKFLIKTAHYDKVADIILTNPNTAQKKQKKSLFFQFQKLN